MGDQIPSYYSGTVMNWRDPKMRGPRPSVGRVNRDYDSDGPGAFRYGRSGTLNEGQNYHNSYN